MLQTELLLTYNSDESVFKNIHLNEQGRGLVSADSAGKVLDVFFEWMEGIGDDPGEQKFFLLDIGITARKVHADYEF